MKIYCTKTTFGLKPSTDQAKEALSKIAINDEIEVEIKRRRNPKHHRKLWALLNLVFENLPTDFNLESATGQQLPIKSSKDILWHVKMQTGHYEQRITMGGKVCYEAKSISFASLSQDDFEVFYSNAVNVILKYFLPQTQKEELIEMVALEF